MPANRNALIRYRILDQCLRNQFRRFELEDLIDACADGLYEYAGIRGGVSKRTVQLDLQMLRSDQLGYNAPIEVYEKKYYRYSDPEYSITNTPLNDTDIDKLHEVVDILRQFSGFSHFNDLSGMVQRLEDKILTHKSENAPIINLEKNMRLKGLEHLDTLYHAIQGKRQIHITYQSFKARTPASFIFHAFLLKEFRNRWFVLGRRDKKSDNLLLALDRIQSLKVSQERRLEYADLDTANYFDDVVGVTVGQNTPTETIAFKVERKNAPYIETKPIHHSQIVLKKDDDYTHFQIQVQWNYELESVFMSHGPSLIITEPRSRFRKMRRLYRLGVENYEGE